MDKRSSELIVLAILLESRSIRSEFISSKNGRAGNACVARHRWRDEFTVECKSVDGENFRFVLEMKSE